jgi:hypothetical protein
MQFGGRTRRVCTPAVLRVERLVPVSSAMCLGRTKFHTGGLRAVYAMMCKKYLNNHVFL